MNSCERCWFRTRYDNNPGSLLGRLWRWHIGFCPGWKKYFNGLSQEQKLAVSEKYDLADRTKSY